MIKAICFDLDGVYFTPESFIRFKKSIPTKVSSEIINYVFHKSQEMNDFKLGKITENDFWDFVRSTLEIPEVTNQEFFKILSDSYQVNSEVKKYIQELRSKGYISCACSNNFETRIRELNNKFSFFEDFDVKVFSYEIGAIKPSKEIFEVLVAKSGVKSNEVVYSDDSEEKLNGAIELGINAFVFENFEQFKMKLKELSIE